MTGEGGVAVEKRCGELGALALFPKPFWLSQFLESLEAPRRSRSLPAHAQRTTSQAGRGKAVSSLRGNRDNRQNDPRPHRSFCRMRGRWRRGIGANQSGTEFLRRPHYRSPHAAHNNLRESIFGGGSSSIVRDSRNEMTLPTKPWPWTVFSVNQPRAWGRIRDWKRGSESRPQPANAPIGDVRARDSGAACAGALCFQLCSRSRAPQPN